ncbi:MAG: radical SAM protein, partial [Candidatus Zixiibacteriota bacterium]
MGKEECSVLEHPQKSEVHCFTVLGRKMILAVDSCLFFETEAIVDEILKVCDGRNKKEIVVELQSNYAETDILTALEELEKVGALKEKDSLTSSYGPLQNAPIKSLALNVCHDCNLRCRYCYGNGGTYGGRKAYMKKEIAEAAVDFLLTNSEAVKKCSIIFFGGEPLLNFELIKRMVEYSEQQAVTAGKRIHFSLTTNGTLFTRQIIDYLNEKKIGVMVSIDGPKKIQDAMRPCLNGKGSYDIILPGLQRFLESRNGNVSARVTYTPNYLNLSEIAKHLSGLGFRRVYLSPATGLDKKNFILTSEHIISVKNELEKIARQTIELGNGDFRE